MRAAPRIEVPEGDREKLERWSSSRSVPVRLRERSLIVLKASEGMTNKEIAAELGAEANKVGRWRRRYADEGLSGIEKERARGGNQGGRSDAERAALRSRIVATTTRLPKDATQWSCRSMARETGASRDFVSRTWRAHGLKPHLSRTFKLSSDPRFEEKLRDVVGLYLDPPENAAVFSFDEKSSIQALEKGRCGTATHDYKRHGATSLFAALNLASGKVVGPVLAPPPPPGGAALPARGGEDGAAGAGHPHRPRQLRHPQAREGEEVGGAEEAGPSALHAHQRVVAEPRGALLRAADRTAAAARRVHLGLPSGEESPAVSGRLQRESAPGWSGRSRPKTSSKRSDARGRVWRQQLNQRYVSDTTLDQARSSRHWLPTPISTGH